MTFQLITPRGSDPVTLAEAKLHLRIDATDEDAQTTSQITAACDDAEHIMGRALLPQTWQLALDSFWDPSYYNAPVPITVDLIRGTSFTTGAAAINLQKPPVTSITSIKYIDVNGALQTMSPANYQLVAASDYTARVVPVYGQLWPSTRGQPEAVLIQFVCGYADAAHVPAMIKHAIKLIVGAMYRYKDPTDSPDYMAAMRCLDRYRTVLF